MAQAPIGAIVSLHYDNTAPGQRPDLAIGHYLRTRTGRTYQILALRQQARGKHTGRYHLKCLVVAPVPYPVNAPVHPLHWYAR
jgi:hypothetical protein